MHTQTPYLPIEAVPDELAWITELHGDLKWSTGTQQGRGEPPLYPGDFSNPKPGNVWAPACGVVQVRGDPRGHAIVGQTGSVASP